MNEQNSRVLKKPKNLNGRVLEKNPKSYLQKNQFFVYNQPKDTVKRI